MSNDEVIGIAAQESKESLDANAERVQSMMAGLMKYVTSKPKIPDPEKRSNTVS